MQFIRGLKNIKNFPSGCVATVGNFDGMHLGHQQLIHRLVDCGRSMDLPKVVIVFEPHPQDFFSKEQSVPRLMCLREKIAVLKKYSIDYLICLRFHRALANLPAEEFVKQILVNQLHVKVLLVGDDFRFGTGRLGNFAMLQTLGEKYGFQAIELPPIKHHGIRVSSTRVRQALCEGNVEEAKHLLGHYYRMCGKVRHGDKRGSDLGFPTANLNLHRKRVPLGGIFVVRIYGIDRKIYEGVASLGIRPTFNGTKIILEVYIFHFHGNIYGRTLEVEFLHKLREEERFETVDQLIQQIHCDVVDAQLFLTHFEEQS